MPLKPEGRSEPGSDLEWLFARQRFGVRPGLERVRALLAALGEPQRAFRTVLVAGTNGKGSTAASLEAALRAGGERTGLFTSPHLTRFCERFVVSGQEVGAEEVGRGLARLRPLAEETGATFFEIVTALACELFAGAKVGTAVMEVGLGGRWDATNALDPVLSVVTQVALDHTAVLGDTLPEIAAEKAGVLRPGRPAVTACAPELWPVLEREGADLWALGRDWHFTAHSRGWEGSDLRVEWPGGAITQVLDFRTPLLGAHGAQNAAVAAVAASRLGCRPDAIRQGLAEVRWPGRLEVLPLTPGQVGTGGETPRILLDGAHNPDGARALAAAMQALGGAPLPLVFGAAEDKDVTGVAEALRPLASSVILTRAALSPRAASPQALAPLFAGLPLTLTDSPAQALAELRRLGAPLSLACGSLYLLGEVRPLLLGEAPEAGERWQ